MEFGVQAVLYMCEQGLEETAGDTRGFFELMPHLWVPQSTPPSPTPHVWGGALREPETQMAP